MMSLLSLEQVSRVDRQGRGGDLVLDRVSFQVESGEHVAVFGQRRSGRTTLLRVVAGLDAPDQGVVRFEGRNLADMPDPVLGRGVSFAHRRFGPGNRHSVVEHVALAAHILGLPLEVARTRAYAALERTGAAACARYEARDLTSDEVARVTIARALVSRPRLLLLDEPVQGLSFSERPKLLRMVRSLGEDGIAVLFTASEAAELRGADRSLKLYGGKLRGQLDPSRAAVVSLKPRASSA